MPKRPSPFRTALFTSGQKQIDVAKRVGIHDTRLSKIARGHIEPTADEKEALARALRKPVSELFPDAEVVAS